MLREKYEKGKLPSFYKWKKEVLSWVRFTPGRKRVSQELEDHFYDRMEAYRGRGLSYDEAEQRTLEALGDPEQTGRLLREVHRPAFFLRVARIILTCVVILFLFSLFNRMDILEQLETWKEDRAALQAATGEALQDQEVLLAKRSGSSSGSMQIGPFELKVRSADQLLVLCPHIEKQTGIWSADVLEYRGDTSKVHYEEDAASESEIHYEYRRRVNLQLRIQSLPWYDVERESIEDHFRIVDNQGHLFVARSGLRDKLMQERHEWVGYMGIQKIEGPQLTGRTWLLSLNAVSDIEWLDLVFEDGQNAQTVRVSFSDWEENRNAGLRSLEEGTTLQALIDMGIRYDFDAWRMGSLKQAPLSVREVRSEPAPGAEHFTVQSARLCRMMQDQELLDYLEKQSSDPVHQIAQELWIMDCVLQIEAPLGTFPIANLEAQDLEIRAEGSEEALPYSKDDTVMVCRDGCVKRIYWKCDPEVQRYILTYTGPDGPESVTLIAGEEVLP